MIKQTPVLSWRNWNAVLFFFFFNVVVVGSSSRSVPMCVFKVPVVQKFPNLEATANQAISK